MFPFGPAHGGNQRHSQQDRLNIESVQRGIGTDQGHRCLADVHRRHLRRRQPAAALSANPLGIRKAVQHPGAFGELTQIQMIGFLIQEGSCFLSAPDIHLHAKPVFLSNT